MTSDTSSAPQDEAPAPRQPPAPAPCCDDKKPLRVAAGSVPKRVAGAIAGQIREIGCAELHAVGPEAVNQTVKSIALSKSYLSSEGVLLDIDIDFMHVEINGEARNGMRFCVSKR